MNSSLSSIELQSSWLPKSAKRNDKIKTVASKLTLKKQVRKSASARDMLKNNRRRIVIPPSSSSESVKSLSNSSENKLKNNCTIIIIDSDDDYDNDKEENKILPPSKKDLVEKWLNYSGNEEETYFDDLSVIFGDQKKIGINNVQMTANSTFISEKPTKRFDELFEKKIDLKSKTDTERNTNNNIVVIEEKFDNLPEPHKNLGVKKSKTDTEGSTNNNIVVIEDKLDNLPEPHKNLGVNKGLTASYVNILNELYGDTWNSNGNEALLEPNCKTEKKNKPDKKLKAVAQTEPKKKKKLLTEKKKKVSLTYKNPYFDSEKEKSNKILHDLQKERIKSVTKSPWAARLKQLCSSDSENDAEKENLIRPNFPVKKLFEHSSEENDSDTNSESTKTKKVKNKGHLKSKISNENKFSNNTDQTNENINFLASLSVNVPEKYYNNQGRAFQKAYKTRKNELARKLFTLYNETVFDSKIPSETDIEWNERMRGSAGFCYCKKITRRGGSVERSVRIALASKILDSADRLRDTLIHEMCHAAAWIINEVSDGHGHYWKLWANKAMRIYPVLPPITRCHDYVVNTKYTYKCTKCGYSLGRHSKSLDVEKKRCGVCYGKFEVYLNKTTKDGNTQMLATPKKELNKFAQFVKDNYGLVKTPDRNHKEVMNLLSKKFSKMTT